MSDPYLKKFSLLAHVDLLSELSLFLDNYTDVEDGDDGRPIPNRAMRLKADVDALLDTCEAERQFQANAEQRRV